MSNATHNVDFEEHKTPIHFSNSFPLVLAGAGVIVGSVIAYLTNALGMGLLWIGYMICGVMIFAVGVRRLSFFLQNLKLIETVDIEGESGETYDKELP